MIREELLKQSLGVTPTSSVVASVVDALGTPSPTPVMPSMAAPVAAPASKALGNASPRSSGVGAMSTAAARGGVITAASLPASFPRVVAPVATAATSTGTPANRQRGHAFNRYAGRSGTSVASASPWEDLTPAASDSGKPHVLSVLARAAVEDEDSDSDVAGASSATAAAAHADASTASATAATAASAPAALTSLSAIDALVSLARLAEGHGGGGGGGGGQSGSSGDSADYRRMADIVTALAAKMESEWQHNHNVWAVPTATKRRRGRKVKRTTLHSGGGGGSGGHHGDGAAPLFRNTSFAKSPWASLYPAPSDSRTHTSGHSRSTGAGRRRRSASARRAAKASAANAAGEPSMQHILTMLSAQ
jgi:hypothetical protein